MLSLDILAFNDLAETAMRLHFRKQADEQYAAHVIAHDDGKRFKKHLKELQSLASDSSEPVGGGDDFIAAMGAMGIGV